MNTGTIFNSLSPVKTTPVILNGSYFATYQPSITNPITNNNQGNPKSRYGEGRGCRGRGRPGALPLHIFLFLFCHWGKGSYDVECYLFMNFEKSISLSSKILNSSLNRFVAIFMPVPIIVNEYLSQINSSSSLCFSKYHSCK